MLTSTSSVESWTAPRRVGSLSLVQCSSARRVARHKTSSVMCLTPMRTRADYDHAFGVVRQVIHAWDPYDLIGGGAPPDEWGSRDFLARRRSASNNLGS